ncbi:MAG TPA: DUF1579 domain-containing protein [Longimicrobium sp.]|jgi:hypothetical protein|uniref:DUF1579 domain-containing protein n=1 Tax=Longimicrobium sp. TaxID=2029185 RepID=UPI002EDAC225
MSAQTQSLHPFLARMLGEWTYVFQATAAQGEPPVRFSGTETVRHLGGVWIAAEGRGENPDGSVSTTLMTLGYDAARQRVAGAYIGSMLAHQWLYDGQVSADGTAVALDSEGPSYTVEGATARYVDTIRFVSDDHRVMTSRFQDENGEWQDFMRIDYHRRD